MTFELDRTQVSTDKSPIILWDNLFTQGTLVASTEDTSGEKENAVDGNTYDYWTPTELPATLEVELSSSASPTYMAIAAHTLGSNGCGFLVQYWAGSTWERAGGQFDPEDDSTIIVSFDEHTSNRWRIRIVNQGTVPSIGVISLGNPTRFDSGILPSYTPLYMAEEIELLKSQTLNGQFITNRVNKRGSRSSFALNILERDFVEGDDFQAFRRHYNDGKPFFFASNPVELPEDVAYCWRQDGGEIRPTFNNDGIFYNTQLSLEAYVGP